jgi:hypothetical protein
MNLGSFFSSPFLKWGGVAAHVSFMATTEGRYPNACLKTGP